MNGWPFVSRTVHRIELAHRDEKIVDLTAQVAYWRTRMERMADQALFRTGAISEPTMRETVVSKDPSPSALISAAMAITEFDSTRGAS